jgi:hypothetical protein
MAHRAKHDLPSAPAKPIRVLWRSKTQNRENNPMQSRMAREKGSKSRPKRIALHVTDAARNVSDLLTRLANSDAATRGRAVSAVVPSLRGDLAGLRVSLDPEPITVAALPASLVRDWVLPDGRARVQVLPKGDPSHNDVLRGFATAVLAAGPFATRLRDQSV